MHRRKRTYDDNGKNLICFLEQRTVGEFLFLVLPNFTITNRKKEIVVNSETKLHEIASHTHNYI